MIVLGVQNIAIGEKLLEVGNHISLKTEESILFKGENGTGKTSLIRAICGLGDYVTADIAFKGEPLKIENHLSCVRDSFSVLLTTPMLANGITVSSYLRMFHGTLDGEREKELIELFNLAPLMGRFIDNLSDGERQKVLLTKVLSKRALLYVLDEPATYLDYKAKASLYSYLKDFAKKNQCSLLIASHDIEQVEAISTRIFQF